MDSVENLLDTSIHGHVELSGRTSFNGVAAGVHLNVVRFVLYVARSMLTRTALSNL